jgi:peptidoglycan/xylan/chitin deacetylase (PgdA/CDA1 family)
MRHIPATFFVGGDWMRTHQSQIQRLASNPSFEIGNHSWSHSDLRQLSKKQIADEALRTESELKFLAGQTTHLFRLPFGAGNEETLQALEELGFAVIQWDVVPGDPDPQVSTKNILESIHRLCRNGSIIVLHANGRGHHTADALPGIIEDLQQRGFELATVSDLMGYKHMGLESIK